MEQDNKWTLPSEKILPQGEVLEKAKSMRVVDALSHCEKDLKDALDLLDEIKDNVSREEDFNKAKEFLRKFRIEPDEAD